MRPDRGGVSLSETAFQEAALLELDAVHRLASQFARDPFEADDLVQQTYLQAFRAASSYRSGPTGMRPWLFRILKNVLLADRRRSKRQTQSSEFDEAESASADAPRLTENARLSDLNWEDVNEPLKQAVMELPAPLRMVFLLFAVEDMKYREIAAALEIPLGTVMSRLNRARRRIVLRLSEAGATARNNFPPQRIGQVG
jgi:RNA polymerase sigma-70 factor (ECF subfamily)